MGTNTYICIGLVLRTKENVFMNVVVTVAILVLDLMHGTLVIFIRIRKKLNIISLLEQRLGLLI